MRGSVTTHAYLVYWTPAPIIIHIFSRARISIESKFIPQSSGGVTLVGHFCELLFFQGNLALELLMSLLYSSIRVLILWRSQSLPV
jgi:hypothetical protein